MRTFLVLCCGLFMIPAVCLAQSAGRVTESEVYRLRYVRPEAIKNLVEQISPQSHTSIVDVGKNMIVIVATPDEHREIQSALLKVDVKDRVAIGLSDGPQSKHVQELIALGKLAEARKTAQQVVQLASKSTQDSLALEQLVREEFSIRQQLQMNEIQQLKTRIQSLEERVLQQETSREELIRQRILSLKLDERVHSPAKKTMASDRTELAVVRRKDAPGAVASGVAQPPFDTSAREASDKSGSPHTVKENYRIRPGDTLGIYIPGVLGEADEKPPIHEDVTGQRPPAMGYPIAVREDGMISLPMIPDQDVAGRSLPEIEKQLRKLYIVDRDILREQAAILVSVIRKVDDVASAGRDRRREIRAPLGLSGVNVTRISERRSPFEFIEKFEKLSGQVDVLTSLYLSSAIPLEDVHDAKRQFQLLEKELRYEVQSIRLDIEATESEFKLYTEEVKRAMLLQASGTGDWTTIHQSRLGVTKSQSKLKQLQSLLELYADVQPAKLDNIKIVDAKITATRAEKQKLLEHQATLIAEQKKGRPLKELWDLAQTVGPGIPISLDDEQMKMQLKRHLDALPGKLNELDETVKRLEGMKRELESE